MPALALPLLLLFAVDDAHVAEALDLAGGNRAELERVLAHYADTPDRLEAARFLIANMPGHGYVITRLADAQGATVEYDPLAYPDFEAALRALEALEEEHGTLDFVRDRMVPDVETASADFLIAHIDRSFAIRERLPDGLRVEFGTFLECLLPYRGSEEPLDDWLRPLFEDAWTAGTPEAARARVREIAKGLMRFDERYYLHPTDQGFSEMTVSGMGRCEDLTNLQTYAMRAVGVATAADFTPWWAHRDNNHAWNVHLDAQGRGFDKANAHAAKVYRKTFAIQRDALCFRLPEGREAPNRFLASPFIRDVTDQYGSVQELTVEVETDEPFAYLCVFNGGEWKAIAWAEVRAGRATFSRLGRDFLCLVAAHDGEELVPVAPPHLVLREGVVRALPGAGDPARVLLTAVRPRQKSPDTGETTPVSFLDPGKAYEFHRWSGGDGWTRIEEFEAGPEPQAVDVPAGDGLYWLVEKDSRRLERPFVVERGRQRWW